MPVPDILKPLKLQTISIVMVKIISQISSDIGIDNKHRPLEYKNEKKFIFKLQATKTKTYFHFTPNVNSVSKLLARTTIFHLRLSHETFHQAPSENK